MNPKLGLLYFFLDLIPPLCLGYALQKRTRLTQRFFDRLMVGNLLTLGVFLALVSFWMIRLNMELIWAPVLGVAMQLIPGGAGFLVARRKLSDSLERGSYILSATLSNRGTVGMLSVFILYGASGYAYTQLVMLLAPLVVYLICFPVARYFYEASQTQKQRGGFRLGTLFLNRNQVPVLGIVAGLVLNHLHVARPAALDAVFPFFVHVSIWLYLLPVGAAMDFHEMAGYWRKVVDLLGIKFIVTPILVCLLSFGVGLRGMSLAIMVILSFSPTAINSVMAARINRLNIHLTMTAFVLTTAVYMAVLFPIILLVLKAIG